jgi:hypothetical protein
VSSLSSCTETIPVAWFTLGPAVLELADGQVSPLDGAWFRQVIRPQLLAAGDTQPSLGVVSVIHLADHVHCRAAELAAAPRLGSCPTSSMPARTLISHTGFLNRRARLRFVHTPRTPAPREPGDSRRAPAFRGYRCTFQGRRDRLRSHMTRVSPQRHQAGPERSTGRGGHSWQGLYKFRWAGDQPTGRRVPGRRCGVRAPQA